LKNKSVLDNMSTSKMRLLFIVILICAILFSLFSSFFTYGKLGPDVLSTVMGTISNVKFEGRNRNHWSSLSRSYLVTFSFSDGNNYFIPVETMAEGRALEDTLTSIQDTVTLTYTSRFLVHPVRALAAIGCKRLVSLETDEREIRSLEDYNEFNKDERITYIAEAAIMFLVVCFLFYWRQKMK